MLSLVLIGVTALTSLAGFANRRVILDYATTPASILKEGRWFQMITGGFLHADLGHLFFNMMTLFFFGPPIERYLGGVEFAIVYFGSMLAGSAMTLALHAKDPGYRAVGASGAVSGVVFSFVLFRPFAPIYIFFIPIGIPAVLFATGYLAVSFIGARKRLGRIGHAAHLGGAIAGLILTILMRPEALRIFLSHF
jgi:membrane associated rhomboid family serine protease